MRGCFQINSLFGEKEYFLSSKTVEYQHTIKLTSQLLLANKAAFKETYSFFLSFPALKNTEGSDEYLHILKLQSIVQKLFEKKNFLLKVALRLLKLPLIHSLQLK